MSDFTVRVELKGRPSEGDEFLRLHKRMGDEGFWPRICPPGPLKKFQPPLPWPASSILPHATYFGASGQEASPLLDHLVSRITAEIHPEIVVFVAETKSYAIYPK